MAKPWEYSDKKSCGTMAAHRRHYRHGEKPCEKCRQAATRDRVERYALRKKLKHRVMNEDQFRDFLLEEGGFQNMDGFFIRHALFVKQVSVLEFTGVEDNFRVRCDGDVFTVDRVKG